MTAEELHNAEMPLDADRAPIGAHAAPSAPVEDEADDPREDALFAERLAPVRGSAEHADTPTSPEADPADAASDAPQASPLSGAPETVDAGVASAASEEPAEPVSPATTAEIDVDEVEARLADPGSTQSFQAIPEDRIDTDSTYDAGTTVNLMWGARSDVGCVRTHNEDSYLVQSPLFCVSDGMGGHAAGEVASSIAVETIAQHAPTSADPAQLARAVEAANAAIIRAAAEGVGRPGMGCTATAAYIEGTQLAIAHVGDSRAYLVHEGTLIRVTRDHSYVEKLVDAGEITADEARVHPNRSVITRALGSDPAMYADHFQLNIEEGDRLILCSDGLSSMIPDGEIENIANQSPTAQICVDNLVDAALAAGGSDNVTVVVVDVVDDGRLREALRRRKRNVLIAVVAVIAALAIAAFAIMNTIANSFYLGIEDGRVAIYTGVPGSFMGISLSQLEDDSEIEVTDLPEDTQRRLQEGITQHSIEEARNVLNEYRRQIFAEQAKRSETARAAESAAGDAADTGGGDAAADEGADASTLADTVAPTQDAEEGGAQ